MFDDVPLKNGGSQAIHFVTRLVFLKVIEYRK